MASSRIYNESTLGDIRITKKKGLKRISMRLHHSGELRVSIPYYLPFAAGLSFAKSQTDWAIKQQQKHQTPMFVPNMTIGKDHQLVYVAADKLSSRVSEDKIVIKLPKTMQPNDSAVIKTTKNAVKRALALEAKNHLPSRVVELANQYGYSYNQVTTKPMKTRWGSCSSAKVISLNIYLQMLPWPIIDYVILHELAHTKHMNHSTSFWDEVQSTTPDYKALKKELKQLQPKVHALYC